MDLKIYKCGFEGLEFGSGTQAQANRQHVPAAYRAPLDAGGPPIRHVRQGIRNGIAQPQARTAKHLDIAYASIRMDSKAQNDAAFQPVIPCQVGVVNGLLQIGGQKPDGRPGMPGARPGSTPGRGPPVQVQSFQGDFRIRVPAGRQRPKARCKTAPQAIGQRAKEEQRGLWISRLQVLSPINTCNVSASGKRSFGLCPKGFPLCPIAFNPLANSNLFSKIKT